MLSANNPVFTMNDSGIDRRMILFRLDRKVENIDPSFDEKLFSQLAAFTNYLLGIPEDEVVETLLYKVDNSGVRIQNELDALLQTNGVAEWLNNRYDYDPSSQVQIGNDKTQTHQLYGDYCDYTSKSGSSPMSSKAFSPEIIRLGRGYLTKKKGMHGAMLQGLKRNDSGGLIEKIISTPTKTPSDPSYPSYPSCNNQNAYQPTVSGMTGHFPDPSFTRHSAENDPLNMTGHDKLMMGESCIRHSTQSHAGQDVQALEKSNMTDMTDMTGQTQLRGERKKIIHLIPDNLSLTQKIIEAWDSPPVLGKIVLEADSYELRKEVQDYTPQKIAHLKEAANVAWKPGLNRDADYKGERVEILEAGQSRDIKIRTASGTTQVIKRGNLRPWLGI